MSPELAIVACVLVLNAFLALAEVAILSVRHSRLRRLADSGNRRARAVLSLAASRWRFLAVIRFGVTLGAVLIGVVAGHTLVEPLVGFLAGQAATAWLAEPLALFIVVVGLSLASFALGEILLKRVALSRPEAAALSVVRPVRLLDRLFGPFAVWLTRGVDALLGYFGLRRPTENRVSEEEVTLMIERGLREGVFAKSEKDMVEAVLALDRMSVMAIMTPRPNMVWLDLTDADEVNWRKIVASGHSYFPVCDGSPDRVAGLLSVKALWANAAAGIETPMRDLLIRPLFVSESVNSVSLLEAFKQAGRRIALVQDEFGTVNGLVTLIDVLEAIVGDLPARGRPPGPEARGEEEGVWLIDATMPLVDLKEHLGVGSLPGEDRADFQTLGGFVMTHVGRIPRQGDAFQIGGFRWLVVSMDRFRVEKVRVTRISETDGPPLDA